MIPRPTSSLQDRPALYRLPEKPDSLYYWQKSSSVPAIYFREIQLHGKAKQLKRIGGSMVSHTLKGDASN